MVSTFNARVRALLSEEILMSQLGDVPCHRLYVLFGFLLSNKPKSFSLATERRSV
jgi:hypothetical protein